MTNRALFNGKKVLIADDETCGDKCETPHGFEYLMLEVGALLKSLVAALERR